MQPSGRKDIIVSLTSFPGAIGFAPGAIRSILEGSVLPDKIVLYVTLSQFGENGLPEELRKLEKETEIFEIRDYPRDIRSYRKLIPALKDFPESNIVTIDDDCHYGKRMLEELVKWHERYPRHIIAHRAKRIISDRPYKKWVKYRWYHFLGGKKYERFDTIQTGVGGVLYPPGSLKTDMLDPEQFTRLAPTADDIWFWGAAVANGTKIFPVPFGQNKPKGLGKPKELSLKAVNFKTGTDRNKQQFDDLLKAYPILTERLKNE